VLSLQYMGHPVFDVGLATIVAHVDKDSPADLTEDNLHSVADFIETHYTKQPLTSFLTVSLMNSDFTQPAFKDKPERRREYARLVGRNFGFDVPKSEEVCVFTGQPALGRSLSLKKDKEGRDELPLGRAYRQHIPLITGEGVINFSAWGDPGLPVSGEALLCLQFFPMGCRKCGGRLLAMHSDNPQIILAAARKALRENTEAISLARARGETKLQDASSSPQTLLIETILDMDLRQLDAKEERQPYSITGYHLTNSGQSSPLDENSPPLRIYYLPMNIVRFLHKLSNPDYGRTWQGLVSRGWERSKPSKRKDSSEEGKETVPTKGRRNYLYEDIFRLPENARSFVRTYLLRSPKRSTAGDPRSDYNPRKDIDLISWQFTELFLEEVMHMNKDRIVEIGKLGETLAAYVKESGDKRFSRKFYIEQNPHNFRAELLRVDRNQVLRGNAPLFGLSSFCTVFFEEDGDTLRLDWKLARDLVYIRILESLYANGWLGKNLDALPDEQDMDHISSDGEQ
jgi:CRISPR-associated protein Cst1